MFPKFTETILQDKAFCITSCEIEIVALKRNLILGLAVLPLPSFLKIVILRSVCGYQIGRGTRIGLSIVCPSTARIGDRVKIGHFNFIGRMDELHVGDDVSIGHANIVMGGRSVRMGNGSVIGRFNEINAILNPIARTAIDSSLSIGARAVITASHKIDYTDRVTIGDNVVIAGRLSNIWTHNRQQVEPVEIGENCYVGSGIQMAPGTRLGGHCVVGMGSIVTKKFDETYKLIAGVPAKVVRDLEDEDRLFVTFPTRPDLDGIEPGAGPPQ